MVGVKIFQIYFLACDVFHLSQGYGFIMMLCSTEVIDGLTLSIPSVTPSQFQQFVMITFFSCIFSQIPYSQHHHLKWAYASSLYGCYSYLYHLGKSQSCSVCLQWYQNTLSPFRPLTLMSSLSPLGP